MHKNVRHSECLTYRVLLLACYCTGALYCSLYITRETFKIDVTDNVSLQVPNFKCTVLSQGQENSVKLCHIIKAKKSYGWSHNNNVDGTHN